MIIYNITYQVEWPVHDSWMSWMKEHNMEILALALFHEIKILRLLMVDESEGPTYAIQYHAHSLKQYNLYREVYEAAQHEKMSARWRNNIVFFSSVMEVVE